MTATLYRIPGPWKGKLAVVPRPRGGDWLEDDLRDLRATGVNVLVSALTSGEEGELGLKHEGRIAAELGIKFVSLPIEDRGVPASSQSVRSLTARLLAFLSDGQTVGVHCRTGIGRSSLLAAAVLASAGVESAAVFGEIEASRGLSVPDTPEQRRWVERFAKELAATREAAS